MLSGFHFIASMMSLFLNTHINVTIILFTLFNLTLRLETREVKEHRNANTIKENLETDKEETGAKPAQKGLTARKSIRICMAPFTQQQERRPYSQDQGRYVNSYYPRQGKRKRKPRPNRILYMEEARDVKTSGNRPYLHETVPGGYRLKSLNMIWGLRSCI